MNTQTNELQKPATFLAKEIMTDIKRHFLQMKKMSPCGFFFVLEDDNGMISMAIPGIDKCFEEGKNLKEHIKRIHDQYKHSFLKTNEKIVCVFIVSDNWDNYCKKEDNGWILPLPDKTGCIRGILNFNDQSSLCLTSLYNEVQQKIVFKGEMEMEFPPLPFLFFPA